jgi:hypothetical protein
MEFNINSKINIRFDFVCELVPKKDFDGNIIKDFPLERYAKKDISKIHKYGRGPFCKFSIPYNFQGKSGIYLILVNNFLVYVGICNDLVQRFNQGYGTIQPRNCFEGGQQTNCRINKLCLDEFENDSKIELKFNLNNSKENREAIENYIINSRNPKWNLI